MAGTSPAHYSKDALFGLGWGLELGVRIRIAGICSEQRTFGIGPSGPESNGDSQVKLTHSGG